MAILVNSTKLSKMICFQNFPKTEEEAVLPKSFYEVNITLCDGTKTRQGIVPNLQVCTVQWKIATNTMKGIQGWGNMGRSSNINYLGKFHREGRCELDLKGQVKY